MTSFVASTSIDQIDALGWPASIAQQVAGLAGPKTMSYTYNVGGAVTGMKYPSDRWVTYDVSGVNRVTSVRRGQTGTDYYATGISYAPSGALGSAVIGQKTGQTTGIFSQSWTYNNRMQARQMSVAAGSVNLLNLRWIYAGSYNPTTFEETAADNNGNVRVERLEYAVGSSTKSATRSYVYDGANRVSSYNEGTGSLRSTSTMPMGGEWSSGWVQ